jgi:hypothetical protein
VLLLVVNQDEKATIVVVERISTHDPPMRIDLVDPLMAVGRMVPHWTCLHSIWLKLVHTVDTDLD